MKKADRKVPVIALVVYIAGMAICTFAPQAAPLGWILMLAAFGIVASMPVQRGNAV